MGKLRIARQWRWLVVVALASCGVGDDDSAGLQDPLAVCSVAFDEGVEAAPLREHALDAAADALTPVALSSCTFDANRNVTIGGIGGCGPRVVIDRSFTGADSLGTITIESGGALVTPVDGTSLEVRTHGIRVSGLLGLGTSKCAVGAPGDLQSVKLVFTGAPVPSSGDPHGDDGSEKGIEVRPGGTLRMIGAKGAATGGVNWTHLKRPAGPPARYATKDDAARPVPSGGDLKLLLARDVTAAGAAWQKGDWIVVATTSFSPFESEFVQLAADPVADGQGGSIVTLNKATPLRHYHFGGADPGLPGSANYLADQSTNFGVDERSEVGLISRSITLTAEVDDTSSDEKARHWGGEIRILNGFTNVTIQGVELSKFGKSRLGSYPIHFHMAGDVSGRQSIAGNSIHHTYNKCVALHGTQNVTIADTVCARAVGHLFYEEMGEEQGARFTGNLGIGAMSHNFGIDVAAVPKTTDGKIKNYWEGDYLAASMGYDALGVPDTDNQALPTHGLCFIPDVNRPGTLRTPPPANVPSPPPSGVPPCTEGQLYVESATGFWMVNPGTVLEGNSIAGCQGMGKGYWYVPPQDSPGKTYTQSFEPVGKFLNNRVHGCYDGLFAENDLAAVSQQLFPTVGGISTGDPASRNIIARFTGLTATRIRNRGVWMRPLWTVVEHGRFATSRAAVSLVSSGGNDGNAPGVWALLADSVLVGLSTNNVDRWGPCPDSGQGDGPGCVDINPKANEVFEHGYQTPRRNSAGYMIYDGPVRILRDRFVNYLKDINPLMTVADRATLAAFKGWPNPKAEKYEGDAALGWFEANQSAYPTATVTRDLRFDNVDLRHQIYTDKVNFGEFKDGDKNTAVIDLDGTLTGYRVVDSAGQPVPDAFPISLNNLPFNHTANAVDECLATGQQDAQFEGRPTSMISPSPKATLEFEAQFPNPGGATWQDVVFTKDIVSNGVHQSMSLQSRNAQGVWEPKVGSGQGYTVTAASSSSPSAPTPKPAPGMPKTVRVGFTDAVKSDMNKSPFYVRVGICYSGANGAPPANRFTITRGYKSWGGNGVNYSNPDMQRYFNFLAGRYKGQTCYNLDHQVGANNDPVNGCPAEGVTAVPSSGACPAPSQRDDSVSPAVCVYPRKTLTAGTLAELTKPDGTPASFDKYYYDAATGMLFFYVMQNERNAHGPSPLGSCPKDAACPTDQELDTFYSCPPQGCTNYSVVLDDPNYTPGPSNCATLAGGSVYKDGRFTLPEPANAHRLAYAVPPGQTASGVVDGQTVVSLAKTTAQGFLHWVPQNAPWCPKKTP